MKTRMHQTLVATAIAALCLAVARPAHAGKEDRDFMAAEAAYRDGNWRKALSKLEDFLDGYPTSEYRERARFYAAECAIEIEKYSIARRHYDLLLEEFPDTTYGTRARFGRALCMAREGRSADAVAALLAVAEDLQDRRDRERCYRAALEVQLERRRYLGALEAMGLLLDDGAPWKERDEKALEEIAGAITEEELLSWESEVRGTTGAGLALYLALQLRGLTEATEVTDPLLFLFADEYPDHPFRDRVEALRGDRLSSPVEADKVGVILPLSGNYRRPGSDVMDGINLALQHRGGGDGAAAGITLVFKDSEGDPERAVAALDELVQQDHVIAVIGPLLSACAVPVAERAEELRVPLIVISQKEGVPLVGRYVMRNFLTPEAQVDAIVDYAIEHRGFRDFAIVYPATEQGGLMADRFWSRVESSGCRVTAIEPYDPDDTDFRKPLRKLYGLRYIEKGIGAVDLELPYLADRSKPQLPDGAPVLLEPGQDFQAVFVPDNFKRVSMIAPAMVHQDINLADTYRDKPPVTLLGGAGFNHEELVKRGGRYVRGCLFVDAFFLHSTEPAMARFVQAFRDAYDRDPGMLEAFGYDTLEILLDALGEEITNRALLRRALIELQPLDSIAGSRGFTREGEMERDFLLLSVEDDQIIQVFPPPLPESLDAGDLLAPGVDGAEGVPAVDPAGDAAEGEPGDGDPAGASHGTGDPGEPEEDTRPVETGSEGDADPGEAASQGRPRAVAP